MSPSRLRFIERHARVELWVERCRPRLIYVPVGCAHRAETVLLFLGMNSNGNNGTGPAHGGQGSSESEAKDRWDIALRGVQVRPHWHCLAAAAFKDHWHCLAAAASINPACERPLQCRVAGVARIETAAGATLVDSLAAAVGRPPHGGGRGQPEHHRGADERRLPCHRRCARPGHPGGCATRRLAPTPPDFYCVWPILCSVPPCPTKEMTMLGPFFAVYHRAQPKR